MYVTCSSMARHLNPHSMSCHDEHNPSLICDDIQVAITVQAGVNVQICLPLQFHIAFYERWACTVKYEIHVKKVHLFTFEGSENMVYCQKLSVYDSMSNEGRNGLAGFRMKGEVTYCSDCVNYQVAEPFTCACASRELVSAKTRSRWQVCLELVSALLCLHPCFP